MTKRLAALLEGYENFLRNLKTRIKSAQLRAALSVNREPVLLYWRIGRDILARQKKAGWGAKGIDRLAEDLRTGIPEMQELSPLNIFYMKELASAYPDPAFAQQVVAQIPCGHDCQNPRLDFVAKMLNNL